ncbi:carboxymuconolactone decarboxylase family protein [Paucibacter sp. DJ2R-2]|uniref:carboxymuconolactone decarboxylase family protein n=1 Tax=Paucibacter sp. DJ2R-2 TaxID=2893558 RepID=UPI0021E4C402|nr:carboxymuconolactone decarboxylase family protein [Paucibacter sp. DJ2R-2]MCV2421657.1 carboxymuconolactone decarboxylase family protein [Paucibacter sp. DJ4R-1]MCV2438362.1 carboxymuconolactone decarboxylase family protein [Paucibacter sp. DJ2R-2]
MKTIKVPSYEQVSPANQAIFDSLKKGLGFVPNLYATFAHSETALATYLALQNAKSSLSPKAREVINLVVSQVNNCAYCLAAHTALGAMLGFTPQQILEIRRGGVAFDARLDALAKLVRNITLERGHAAPALVQAFFAAGWTEANLVDALVVVGDKMVSNFLHGSTQIPVDFAAAPSLDA